jgi:hypothetical protein
MTSNSNRQNSNKLQHGATSAPEANYPHSNNSADCLEPTDVQRLNKPKTKDSSQTSNNVGGRKEHGIPESNDCNQSNAPSPSPNDSANYSQLLSCDQTGALVLAYLQRGACVIYDSSIHKWTFWFRCGDQSFRHDTMGQILFTSIRELITQSESRKIMLRFKTQEDMFMIFKKLNDANIFTKQLRPHVTCRFDG